MFIPNEREKILMFKLLDGFILSEVLNLLHPVEKVLCEWQFSAIEVFCTWYVEEYWGHRKKSCGLQTWQHWRLPPFCLLLYSSRRPSALYQLTQATCHSLRLSRDYHTKIAVNTVAGWLDGNIGKYALVSVLHFELCILYHNMLKSAFQFWN